MFEMRESVHHGLDRNCDLLFNLFGRPAGPLRDDVDVVIRDVRVGFDRQLMKGDGTPDKEQEGAGKTAEGPGAIHAEVGA